ncbi:MAG TPA: cold shock and DUF1294 domain-containing protein [Planctomycetaceae bacterium]|nr:cold shock and DUF1294 domain-containing protein [Planctomycetaceae bacterium]
MQYQGRIENWNDERGFGFVTPEGGGRRVFVHVNEFSDRRRRPVDGDAIVYEIGLDSENRPQAVKIRFQSSGPPVRNGYQARRASGIGFGGFVGVAFLCLLVVLCVLKVIPVWLPLLYLLLSLITLLVYSKDKSAAQNNRWRTSEKSLQVLALVGGWPGALLGQNLFRHKNRKLEFQIVFWFVVWVNCGIFALSMTDLGTEFFRSLTGPSREYRLDSERHDDQFPRTHTHSASSAEVRPASERSDQRLPLIRPLPRSSNQSFDGSRQ